MSRHGENRSRDAARVVGGRRAVLNGDKYLHVLVITTLTFSSSSLFIIIIILYSCIEAISLIQSLSLKTENLIDSRPADCTGVKVLLFPM